MCTDMRRLYYVKKLFERHTKIVFKEGRNSVHVNVSVYTLVMWYIDEVQLDTEDT